MPHTNTLLLNYGPYALVTGASSGIGHAMAKQLAQLGFNLVLPARRIERLQALAAQLHESCGVEVKVFATDVGVLSDLERLLAETSGLDIGLVISNAGFSIKGDFAEADLDLMLEMIKVNCEAPMVLAHGFIPRLKLRQRGALVFTSSVEALIGCPYSTAYSASKALVKSLGEGLWAELKPDGIDVLTLCPGATDTEGLRRSGFDPSKMPHVMSAEQVAALALANIDKGPILVSSEYYTQMFDQLTAMPRDKALRIMAQNMRT